MPIEPPEMTFQEFLAWADEDTLAEWIALPGEATGAVVMTSPASDRHQDISDFLTSVMRIFIESRDLGRLRSAPFQIKLTHSREPDLLFVRRENLSRFENTCLNGPADLAVEIMSPESAGRDRGEKFYEYAQGGVSEYWLIDPQTQWAEFYQLQEEHYYPVFSGREGRYEARVARFLAAGGVAVARAASLVYPGVGRDRGDGFVAGGGLGKDAQGRVTKFIRNQAPISPTFQNRLLLIAFEL